MTDVAARAMENDIAWGIREVQKFTGLTRVAIHRMSRKGNFPAPWHVSRSRRWWRSDVVAWLEERIKNTPKPKFPAKGGGK